jgi:protein-tyrosine phosphatase
MVIMLSCLQRIAEDSYALTEHNIFAICNTMEIGSQCFHEKDTRFEYFRFPISMHYKEKNIKTTEGVREYFSQVFAWIDQCTAQGKNVLIHCLAGAHRAGTTSVAYIMHAGQHDLPTALAAAQQCRSIINPIGMFPELLNTLDLAIREGKGGVAS